MPTQTATENALFQDPAARREYNRVRQAKLRAEKKSAPEDPVRREKRLARQRAYQRRYYQENREKCIAYRMKHHRAHPERARAANLKQKLRKRGLSPEKYQEMLEKQDYRCAVCRRENLSKRRFHVDHCHKSGAVRGLLCSPCNTAIGLMGDSPRRLRAAVRYLEQTGLPVVSS